MIRPAAQESLERVTCRHTCPVAGCWTGDDSAASGGMNPGHFLPAAQAPLSKRLAGAYLAVVGFTWLTHIVGPLLLLATGRSSWSTQNPWVVIPVFVVIVSAIAVVWLVDQRLHENRPSGVAGFRVLGLAYGYAVPTAWRVLHQR